MKRYDFDPQPYSDQIAGIIQEIEKADVWRKNSLQKILVKFPRDGNSIFSRDQLIIGYKQLIENEGQKLSQIIMDRLRMKPTRTLSGVAPVTVLTKPFPCPGKCIFCPDDIRMPKSYLADEPGAQRAKRNRFDPYLQTYNRLRAMSNTGHTTSKVELIILGGTWSFYPEKYQIWFVKRCFDALNDFGVRDGRDEMKTTGVELVMEGELSDWNELEKAHSVNEDANARCVGLVIETRPDYIDKKEILKLRRLGTTKVQIGIQSLNDRILRVNKRGHSTAETKNAIRLLRQGGLKIHAHWMPGLYGSNVEEDIRDYKRLWTKDVRPDELKIYPTSIIANTELFEKYKSGDYKPYSYDQLLEVLTSTMKLTPRYCRLTRVIRDIPSTDIVAGNKLTNFRQIAEQKLMNEDRSCQCIRCREIRSEKVSESDLILEEIGYRSSVGKEIFISYKTASTDKLVGFLRLSLPDSASFIDELSDNAVIREIHVYGQVVGVGKKRAGKAQHLGVGRKLLKRAYQLAKAAGRERISVISAVGTRSYYKKHGFKRGQLYMSRSI
ncbi:MAG: elongator complex protein 3 [Candidatus Dojkabacteria bacterium]